MSKAVNVTRRWSGVRQKCVLFVLACFVMPICTGQKIDCSSGFLCDFFSKFPHLPFTRLHPNNAGYIRTLDYLIHKESNYDGLESNEVSDDGTYNSHLDVGNPTDPIVTTPAPSPTEIITMPPRPPAPKTPSAIGYTYQSSAPYRSLPPRWPPPRAPPTYHVAPTVPTPQPYYHTSHHSPYKVTAVPVYRSKVRTTTGPLFRETLEAQQKKAVTKPTTPTTTEASTTQLMKDPVTEKEAELMQTLQDMLNYDDQADGEEMDFLDMNEIEEEIGQLEKNNNPSTFKRQVVKHKKMNKERQKMNKNFEFMDQKLPDFNFFGTSPNSDKAFFRSRNFKFNQRKESTGQNMVKDRSETWAYGATDVGNLDYTNPEVSYSKPADRNREYAVFDPKEYSGFMPTSGSPDLKVSSRASKPSGVNTWNDFGGSFEHQPLADIQHTFESMMMDFDSKKISGFHQPKDKMRKQKRKIVKTSSLFTPMPKLLSSPAPPTVSYREPVKNTDDTLTRIDAPGSYVKTSKDPTLFKSFGRWRHPNSMSHEDSPSFGDSAHFGDGHGTPELRESLGATTFNQEAPRSPAKKPKRKVVTSQFPSFEHHFNKHFQEEHHYGPTGLPDFPDIQDFLKLGREQAGVSNFDQHYNDFYGNLPRELPRVPTLTPPPLPQQPSHVPLPSQQSHVPLPSQPSHFPSPTTGGLVEVKSPKVLPLYKPTEPYVSHPTPTVSSLYQKPAYGDSALPIVFPKPTFGDPFTSPISFTEDFKTELTPFNHLPPHDFDPNFKVFEEEVVLGHPEPVGPPVTTPAPPTLPKPSVGPRLRLKLPKLKLKRPPKLKKLKFPIHLKPRVKAPRHKQGPIRLPTLPTLPPIPALPPMPTLPPAGAPFEFVNKVVNGYSNALEGLMSAAGLTERSDSDPSPSMVPDTISDKMDRAPPEQEETFIVKKSGETEAVESTNAPVETTTLPYEVAETKEVISDDVELIQEEDSPKRSGRDYSREEFKSAIKKLLQKSPGSAQKFISTAKKYSFDNKLKSAKMVSFDPIQSRRTEHGSSRDPRRVQGVDSGLVTSKMKAPSLSVKQRIKNLINTKFFNRGR